MATTDIAVNIESMIRTAMRRAIDKSARLLTQPITRETLGIVFNRFKTEMRPAMIFGRLNTHEPIIAKRVLPIMFEMLKTHRDDLTQFESLRATVATAAVVAATSATLVDRMDYLDFRVRESLK